MALNKKNCILLMWLSLIVAFLSCKKMTQVSEPVNTVTTTAIFSSDAPATSAVVGIYNDMLSRSPGYGSGATSYLLGLSADELNNFKNNNSYALFQANKLNSSEAMVRNGLWTPLYFNIYLANAIINGLDASEGVTPATKDQLIGEAKFFRSFCYFYLVNLFGDIPYLHTTDYVTNSTAFRTPANQVYEAIMQDLKDAKNLLKADYSVSGGERIRVNKWGASALLSRAYLYTGDWKNAELEASSVIDVPLFKLVNDLKAIFLANSDEVILQLQTPNAGFYATSEGRSFVPPNRTSAPNFTLTTQLFNTFEQGDKRKSAWIDSSKYLNVFRYFPYKYKVYQGTQGNITEYYTVLRLAEQYLIRAEARAMQKDLTGALTDLNTIRTRAGLPVLPSSLDQNQLLDAIAKERRIELFAEWGHRWLDLKRTGQADAVLAPIKTGWSQAAVLYPIPASELVNDANLLQNQGY